VLQTVVHVISTYRNIMGSTDKGEEQVTVAGVLDDLLAIALIATQQGPEPGDSLYREIHTDLGASR
jgi:hypothetical protein